MDVNLCFAFFQISRRFTTDAEFDKLQISAPINLLIRDQSSTVNDYPHIVDDQTWGTGIVVFNCNDEPNELNVVAYDDDGNRIAQVERQLAAHEKLLGQASAQFDGMDISEATNIRFMSESGGVAAFQINSTANNLMDAIPGL